MTEFSIDMDSAKVRAQLDKLKEQYDDDPIYVVSSNAEYAIYLETGTRHMPPYPSFGPAVNELRADPEAFLLKNSELDGLGDIDSTEELVKNVAFALESQIKTNVTAAAGGRSPGVDPDHPQVQTGNLRARISAKRIK